MPEIGRFTLRQLVFSVPEAEVQGEGVSRLGLFRGPSLACGWSLSAHS